MLSTIVAPNCGDDGDGVYDVSDGVGHATKQDWMIVPACCLPLMEEPIALGERSAAQKQKEPVQLPAR
jgi:hypothetical protein